MTDLESRPGITLTEDEWPGLFDVPSGFRTRVSAAVARRIFAGVTHRLGIRIVGAGEAVDDGVPTMILNRPREFHARIGRQGLIGFGESYMTRAWDSPDLGLLLTVLARDLATLIPTSLQRMRKAYVARFPHTHHNSVDNALQNISHHYDLSNDLFQAFLDETMTYSSALFASSDPEVLAGVDRAQLVEAQVRKIERLLDQAGVVAGSRVLEIGTGWGELALLAARRGAQVRSVTLSREQQGLARQRIADAGLSDRVSVELLDYRLVDGEYDAVLSVEMIEAVGHEFLPEYFATIDRLLTPGGRAGIQAITMAHDRMLATMGTYTWIHKYIFPGGFLPSSELIDEITSATSMALTDRFSFNLHYAETLRLWDQAFMATDPGHLGFDETFRRMWHFYLMYSRAGFASGYLDVQQLTFTKAAG